jgi:hypothetical protein
MRENHNFKGEKKTITLKELTSKSMVSNGKS